MILSSFHYFYTILATGNTGLPVTIDFDFRALYQINPDHLIVLKYASIVSMRIDAGAASFVGDGLIARVIGSFNETRNILASIAVPRATETVVGFDGFGFTPLSPFVAPEKAKILMPPTFQIEFQAASRSQVAANDSMEVYITIGYDIEQKNSFHK